MTHVSKTRDKKLQIDLTFNSYKNKQMNSSGVDSTKNGNHCNENADFGNWKKKKNKKRKILLRCLRIISPKAIYRFIAVNRHQNTNDIIHRTIKSLLNHVEL